MPYILGIALIATAALLAWGLAAAYNAFLAQRHKALVFPCRISTNGADGATKYRITVVLPVQDYVEAESKAQAHVDSLLDSRRNEIGDHFDVKWLKTRWLTAQSLREESEEVKELLKQLQKNQLPIIAEIERIDAVPAPRGLLRETPSTAST
jgi:hypothetical protein